MYGLAFEPWKRDPVRCGPGVPNWVWRDMTRTKSVGEGWWLRFGVCFRAEGWYRGCLAVGVGSRRRRAWLGLNRGRSPASSASQTPSSAWLGRRPALLARLDRCSRLPPHKEKSIVQHQSANYTASSCAPACSSLIRQSQYSGHEQAHARSASFLTLRNVMLYRPPLYLSTIRLPT